MDERTKELEGREKELGIAREAVEVKSRELKAREEAFKLVQKKDVELWRKEIELADKVKREIQVEKDSVERKLREVEEKEDEFESLGSYIEERAIRVRASELQLEERQRAIEAKEKEIERIYDDLKSREGELETRLCQWRGKEGRIGEMESEIQAHKRRLGELDLEVKVLVEVVRGLGDEVKLKAEEMIRLAENRVEDGDGELNLQRREVVMEMEKSIGVKERELGCEEEERLFSSCNDAQLVVEQTKLSDDSNMLASKENGEHGQCEKQFHASVRRWVEERLKKRHAADSVDRTQTSLVEERLKKRHVDSVDGLVEENGEGPRGKEMECNDVLKSTSSKGETMIDKREVMCGLKSLLIERQKKLPVDSVAAQLIKENSEGNADKAKECNAETRFVLVGFPEKGKEPGSSIRKCSAKLHSTEKQSDVVKGNNGEGSTVPSSRYQSRKRKEWKRFLRYYSNKHTPKSVLRCTGAEVVEYLKQSRNPCHSGILESLVGRLSVAYEECGVRPEWNPFKSREVSDYLKGV